MSKNIKISSLGRALAFLFLIILFQPHEGFAQTPRSKGWVHEAYLPAVTGINPLEAISTEPPSPLQEVTPQQPEPDTIWIPGYWTWDPERNNFVWINGVWRLPPPNQKWIPGYWMRF